MGKINFSRDGGQNNLVVDNYIEDKPLSVLLSEIRELLKSYQNKVSVETIGTATMIEEVVITARIQAKRK